MNIMVCNVIIEFNENLNDIKNVCRHYLYSLPNFTSDKILAMTKNTL